MIAIDVKRCGSSLHLYVLTCRFQPYYNINILIKIESTCGKLSIDLHCNILYGSFFKHWTPAKRLRVTMVQSTTWYAYEFTHQFTVDTISIYTRNYVQLSDERRLYLHCCNFSTTVYIFVNFISLHVVQ